MAGYKYFKLNITNFRRNTDTTPCQFASLAEFNLYDAAGNNVSLIESKTITASSQATAQPAPAVSDGDISTYWQSKWYDETSKSTTNWVQLQFSSPHVVAAYGLVPHNDGSFEDRPITFQLLGSNDGTNYDVLDGQINLTDGWQKGVERKFDVRGGFIYRSACYTTDSGTSLTGNINTNAGDWVLATVTTRSPATWPDGWTVLHESPALNSDNLNQRVATLCKKAETGGSVSFTAVQTTAARLYINLIAVQNTSGFVYHPGTELVDNTKLSTRTIQRPDYTNIIWVCTAALWSTVSPFSPWMCAELDAAICLPNTIQQRQANFIDCIDGASRTFTTPATGAIIDCVEILMGQKYLIQSDNVLYTIVDGELQALGETGINAALFEQYGMVRMPNIDTVMALVDPSILCWQNSTDALPTFTATVAAEPPKPQIVTTSAQNMGDPTIIGISSAVISSSDDVLFSISFDDGGTWWVFTESAWAQITEPTAGMTKATMEAITAEQWNTITTSTSYKIRFVLPAITSYVANIAINYAN